MEFEDLKINLRATLLSTKSGTIPLHQLPNEFKKLSGKPLDYELYGYASLSDMLNDMRDTVRLSAGGCLVHGLSNANTSHIESLIKNQRLSSGDLNNSRSIAYVSRANRRSHVLMDAVPIGAYNDHRAIGSGTGYRGPPIRKNQRSLSNTAVSTSTSSRFTPAARPPRLSGGQVSSYHNSSSSTTQKRETAIEGVARARNLSSALNKATQDCFIERQSQQKQPPQQQQQQQQQQQRQSEQKTPPGLMNNLKQENVSIPQKPQRVDLPDSVWRALLAAFLRTRPRGACRKLAWRTVAAALGGSWHSPQIISSALVARAECDWADIFAIQPGWPTALYLPVMTDNQIIAGEDCAITDDEADYLVFYVCRLLPDGCESAAGC